MDEITLSRDKLYLLIKEMKETRGIVKTHGINKSNAIISHDLKVRIDLLEQLLKEGIDKLLDAVKAQKKGLLVAQAVFEEEEQSEAQN